MIKTDTGPLLLNSGHGEDTMIPKRSNSHAIVEAATCRKNARITIQARAVAMLKNNDNHIVRPPAQYQIGVNKYAL